MGAAAFAERAAAAAKEKADKEKAEADAKAAAAEAAAGGLSLCRTFRAATGKVVSDVDARFAGLGAPAPGRSPVCVSDVNNRYNTSTCWGHG